MNLKTGKVKIGNLQWRTEIFRPEPGELEHFPLKVLLMTPNIPDYRLDIYNELGSFLNLTILHNGEEIIDPDNNFNQICYRIRKIGPFTYLSKNIHRICQRYDVVISESNIRHIDRDLLILNPFRSYKWISWGIGVSASYNKRYDSDRSLSFIRNYIFKHADANVFYSSYPIKKYLKAGFHKDSLFVANNTTSVSFNENAKFLKRKLLFVGTLYRQKKIFELLNSYKEAFLICDTIFPLDIIGDGPEFGVIQQWIIENHFQNKIQLHGSIYDKSILERHFREAYACISPGQAGLSVLTSMGYGTPFITRKDAITGGEIFNIANNITGILYNYDDELKSIILEITHNPEKFIKMGKIARNYYLQNRQVKNMVEGFTAAIKFVLIKNKTFNRNA